MKPGATTRPVGVDRRRRAGSSTSPIATMRPSRTPTSAAPRRRAGAVDDRSPSDHQVHASDPIPGLGNGAPAPLDRPTAEARALIRTRLVQYCVSLQTDHVAMGDEFSSGDRRSPQVAQAAEAAGFDAVFVTEHPFPENEWLATGGHHALDPFVALAFAAAATTRLRRADQPLRRPVPQPLSPGQGRAHPRRRVRRAADLRVRRRLPRSRVRRAGPVTSPIATTASTPRSTAMQAAWTGRAGRRSPGPAGAHTMLPRPVQSPGPPIWIGGNSRARSDVRSSSATAGCRSRTRPRPRRAARRPSCRPSTSSRHASTKPTTLEAASGRQLRDVMFSPVGADAYGAPGLERRSVP